MRIETLLVQTWQRWQWDDDYSIYSVFHIQCKCCHVYKRNKAFPRLTKVTCCQQICSMRTIKEILQAEGICKG